jgi:hypothetical protein
MTTRGFWNPRSSAFIRSKVVSVSRKKIAGHFQQKQSALSSQSSAKKTAARFPESSFEFRVSGFEKRKKKIAGHFGPRP